jgi:hypothetical protein
MSFRTLPFPLVFEWCAFVVEGCLSKRCRRCPLPPHSVRAGGPGVASCKTLMRSEPPAKRQEKIPGVFEGKAHGVFSLWGRAPRPGPKLWLGHGLPQPGSLRELGQEMGS